MRFTINRAPFLKALESARRVADSKSTMPILANVHLHVVASALSARVAVTATDLVTTTRTTLNCAGASPGGITLPAKTLRDAVAAITADEVTVEVLDRYRVEITASTSGNAADEKKKKSKSKAKSQIRYAINGMAEADFPRLADVPERGYCMVSSEDLRRAVDRVAPSMCQDATRSHLNGARVVISEGSSEMTVVSTDGHRLTLATAPVEGAVNVVETVSRDGFLEIARLAAEVDRVHLCAQGGYLFAKMTAGGDTSYAVTAKLMEGGFPPYQQVIPNRLLDSEVQVDREALLGALRRAMTITKTRGTAFSLSPGSLRVKCDDPDVGDFSEDVDAYSVNDNLCVTVGLNVSYVVDAVSRVTTDCVVMQVDGELSPVTIRETGDASSFTAVIMPVRL